MRSIETHFLSYKPPLAALLCRFFVSVLRVYLQRCYACYNSRPYVSALSTKGFA